VRVILRINLVSFLGALKDIGKTALGIARSPVAATIVSAVNPALGAIWGRAATAITNIEAAHAAAGREKTGSEKLNFVITDFEESLAVTREILKLQGKELVYDAGRLKEAIDAQVAAFNATARLKETFQIRDLQ
jgi:hypothetical protein